MTFRLADGKGIRPGRYVVLIAKRAPRPKADSGPAREDEQINILFNELPPLELKSRSGH